jgi:hypothetical protein
MFFPPPPPKKDKCVHRFERFSLSALLLCEAISKLFLKIKLVAELSKKENALINLRKGFN